MSEILDLNDDVSEKVLAVQQEEEKISLFQAVMMPPEAPTDGRKSNDLEEGGRNELALKEFNDSNLDSCRHKMSGGSIVRAALTSIHF